MTRLILLITMCIAGCRLVQPNQHAPTLQWLGSSATDPTRVRFSLVVVGHESMEAVLNEFELSGFHARDNTGEEWCLREVGHGPAKGGPGVFISIEKKDSRATVVECTFECRFELDKNVSRGDAPKGRIRVSVTFRRDDPKNRWSVDIAKDVTITPIQG